MKVLILILAFISFLPPSLAQGGFSTLYPQSIGAYTGCVGPNNTYLAAGQVPLAGGYTGAAFILVDSTGTVLRSDTLTHPQRSLFPGLQGCAHFDYGHYWIAGQAFHRGWIAKLKPNLDTVWSRVFRQEDSVDLVLYGSLVVSKNRYVVVGESAKIPPWDSVPRNSLYLAEFDSLGQRQWERNYFAPEPMGQPMWQWGNGLIETPDGGYLVYGNRAEEGNGNNSIDYLLLKVDSVGNEEWVKALGTQYSDKRLVVLPESDSTYRVFSTLAVPKNTAEKPRYYEGYLQSDIRRYSDGSLKATNSFSPYLPGNTVMSVVPSIDSGFVVLGSYYPQKLNPLNPVCHTL